MEPSSQNSVVDKATLSVAQFFHCLSELAVLHHASKSLNKPPKDAHADDHWLAGAKVKTAEYSTGQGAWSFKAVNLTLFHMALLAHVVHTEYPLYSLFKNNCYWFSNVMYLATKFIDKALGPNFDHSDHSGYPEEDSKGITDDFFLPFYLYLPQVAGRWMGFKICEVQEIVVERIVRLFHEQLEMHENKVFLP